MCYISGQKQDIRSRQEGEVQPPSHLGQSDKVPITTNHFIVNYVKKLDCFSVIIVLNELAF